MAAKCPLSIIKMQILLSEFKLSLYSGILEKYIYRVSHGDLHEVISPRDNQITFFFSKKTFIW